MDTAIIPRNESTQTGLYAPAPPLSLASVPAQTQGLLSRMFADPRVLSKSEAADLVAQLRGCVTQNPEVSDLRVIFGMALCVNLDVHAAMEELAEAVRLAPQSYIAHLKMGELWMRLRVMNKAKDHTHQAAMLAQNLAQSEMARRQATTIRAMMQKGIERPGFSRRPLLALSRLRRLVGRRRREELAPIEAQ
jgi:cytochrome c-type biogenesis protein CcmH/NrfG